VYLLRDFMHRIKDLRFPAMAPPWEAAVGLNPAGAPPAALSLLPRFDLGRPF
jgi:hypothetical protein